MSKPDRSDRVCNHVQMGGRRDYDRPPVKTATLTVYVEPVENFDLAFVTRLYTRWSERFPGLQQTFPRPRPDELPSVSPFQSAPGWFPLPSVTLFSSSLSRAISFQFDQVSLSWHFDTDAADSSYPGYRTLSKELHTNFEYFAETVEQLSDKPLKVQGCQVEYENQLDTVDSVDWIVGYLSDWKTAATNRLEGAEYIGFRWRNGFEVNDENGTRRTAHIQLGSGADYESADLDIYALSLPIEGSTTDAEAPTELARRLLDDAHDLENSTFEMFINDEMRAHWGVS